MSAKSPSDSFFRYFIVIVIVGFGIFMVEKFFSPIEKGSKKLYELASKAINNVSNVDVITRTFASTATEIHGSNRLQIAQLKQHEIFKQTTEATRLGFKMPDLKVSFNAPVEYTYYLDFEDVWHIREHEGYLHVQAPALKFNMPAIDVSALEFKVDQGSILRNSDTAKKMLQQELTPQVLKRAQQNMGLIRSTARDEVEKFVRNFYLQQSQGQVDLPVKVIFADEIAPVATQPKL